MSVKHIKPVENLLTHQFGAEAVMLNLNNEMYYALDNMAIRMWQVLTTTQSVEDAVQQLLSEYDVEEVILRDDLDTLINYLINAKMITVELT